MDEYQINAITEERDNRRDALNKLLMSGVLSTVSIDMANKMWDAIMK